jgi:hypothetical protein
LKYVKYGELGKSHLGLLLTDAITLFHRLDEKLQKARFKLMTELIGVPLYILVMSPCFTRSLKPGNCHMHAKNPQCQTKSVAHN